MLVKTRLHPAGINVAEFGRAEFVNEIWQYRPGEHVSLIGPTEAGKTTLGYELLQVTARPEMPAVVLVMKPRDRTVSRWNDRLGFQVTRTWPPALSLFKPRRPPGYTLWPRHDLKNYGATNLNLHRQFKKAFLWAYGSKGAQIIFADELAGLDDELGMSPEIKMMYSRGRAMDGGIWGATQRPVDIPKLAYSSANHLFLAYMPDESDRKRFAEIGGGIDSKLIEEITLRLPQYWWLYVRRRDRTLCIVRA